MTKTSKKILLVLLIALLTVFAFSAKAFAASNDAVDTFKDKNNFKDQTIFVGQKVPVQPDDYSVRYSLSPRVTSSNTKVVDFQDSSNYYLVAKAEGTSTITLECYNGNELLKQSYNIKVVKVKESNYVEKKDKVLYANGELWDLDITTNKFTKNTGNVKKYTYGDVYFKEGKNTKYPSIFNTLKNNGKLTTKTDVGNLKADKALVITENDNKNVILSARNIPDVKTEDRAAINVYDILKYDCLVMTKDAVKAIEEVYA